MLHVRLCVHVHPLRFIEVGGLELSAKALDSTLHPYNVRLGVMPLSLDSTAPCD